MHKAKLALAVLGSSLSLYAQNCNTSPPPQQLFTYYPWVSSFYYGNVTGNTFNMFFDLDVQTPITINQLLTVTYDRGTGNPVVPNQAGNIAEVRFYFIPGSRTGNERTMLNWGIDAQGLGTADGLPEFLGEMTVTATDSPITNFKDATTGLPAAFTIHPGQWGVCMEFIPTTWTGTAALPQTNVPLLNPGSLHTLGVSPNPNTPWSDQFITLSNDGIAQNGWQNVDPTGTLIPNVTPNGTQDSINLYIDYTPDPAAGLSVPFGAGCYDAPRMVYELIPSGTTPIDLINTAYTFIYQPSPSGGNYLITGGGAPYDGATAAAQGTNIVTGASTTTSSGTPGGGGPEWDDASLIYTLSTTLFPGGLPFPGGSCTDITINSNGKIFLGPMSNSSWDSNGANYGSLAAFQGALPSVQLPAQMQAFSCDFDPTAGGGIYVEEPSPNGGIRITWHQVPNWPTVAGRTCNIQVELLPTGICYWAFGNDLVCDPAANTNAALVGFSAGFGQPIGPAIDWSAITVRQTGDGSQAPVLGMASRPVINSTADVVISNLTPGTASPFGGFLSVGLGGLPAGLPLNMYGLGGCEAHIDLGLVVFTVIMPNPSGIDMRWSWTVPAAANGVQIFFQGATLTPNPYNNRSLLVTNALCAKVGS
jgi:hypothetical protein